MDLKLNGKTALITGSTVGIGLAIAESLAREKAHVFVNGRTQTRVDAAVSELRSKIPAATVTGIAADLSNASGARTLIGSLPVVDVLVNNVGIFEPKPFLETPDEDWYRFFEVNVMSGVRLSQHYLYDPECRSLHVPDQPGPGGCRDGEVSCQPAVSSAQESGRHRLDEVGFGHKVTL